MISNQDPIRYRTATKLGLIPMEGGTRSSVLTSYFKVKKCGNCTLPVFAQVDGKYFLPPIIAHQSKEYSQGIHLNIPLELIVRHTPSGYMDRDKCIKSMTQLFNVYSASPTNNQMICLDGHSSHFGDGALRKLMCKNIQLFVLKSGEFISNQPNDNDPNAKLNSIYNVANNTWILKYGMTKCLP